MLDGEDGRGQPVVASCTRTRDACAPMAVLDAVVNNADRKGATCCVTGRAPL